MLEVVSWNGLHGRAQPACHVCCSSRRVCFRTGPDAGLRTGRRGPALQLGCRDSGGPGSAQRSAVHRHSRKSRAWDSTSSFTPATKCRVPLKELAGSENQLTMVFRVTPEDHPDEPVYFSQHIPVPAIEEDAGGPAYLHGHLRRGRRQVSRRLADARPRGARLLLRIGMSKRSLPAKDKQMALDIAPAIVQPADTEPFKQEPPVEREQHEGPLNVKVVVNFAPQDSGSATLQPLDTNALLSILRNIAREPRIGKFSIVAYNMQEQRVIYRQEDASQIDFPGARQGAEFAQPGDGGSEAAEPEARRHGVPGQPDHQGTEGPEAAAGRRDLRRPQGDAGRRASAGHPEAAFRRQATRVLHELQPESAGESLAGRHRQRREVPQGRRVYHHPSARSVFLLERNHGPYCKIEVREDGKRQRVLRNKQCGSFPSRCLSPPPHYRPLLRNSAPPRIWRPTFPRPRSSWKGCWRPAASSRATWSTIWAAATAAS